MSKMSESFLSIIILSYTRIYTIIYNDFIIIPYFCVSFGAVDP